MKNVRSCNPWGNICTQRTKTYMFSLLNKTWWTLWYLIMHSTSLCKHKQSCAGCHFPRVLRGIFKRCVCYFTAVSCPCFFPPWETYKPPREQADESIQQCNLERAKGHAFPPHQLHTQQVIECLAGNRSSLHSFLPALLPSVNPIVYSASTALLPF